MNPNRLIIEKLNPEINNGLFSIKRVLGEKVKVLAHIYADGHDAISAQLIYKTQNQKNWNALEMTALGNDEWTAEFNIKENQDYQYCVQSWIDHFKTLLSALEKKLAANQNVSFEIEMLSRIVKERALMKGAEIGKVKKISSLIASSKKENQKINILTSDELSHLMVLRPAKDSFLRYPKILNVSVEREKAGFSAWYEMFPRSCGLSGKHGTFTDCEKLLSHVSKLGFDVIYLPPIHPIGKTKRKGKNNAVVCQNEDPGSPWAIGSCEGGHKSINPELGTLEDFKSFVKAAKTVGIEIALDLAYQCSPDHPYIKEHPQWFKWRFDKTIQYAENPPKKYEDIVPINFETVDVKALWKELKSVVDFWIKAGVKIFRVDNPHTKPFAFWQWLISEVRKENPDIIFLAEAFTRPKIMYMLGKVGFTQSYTYFTWRNTKEEITEYMKTLTKTEVSEFFRPNFWPNTPDILSEIFQKHGRPAFVSRFILAATLSSNYGIYGPAYELCVNEPVPGKKEDYLDSEKYEIKAWDRNRAGNISGLISKVNKIRKENPAFHKTSNIEFIETDNEMIIAYMKRSEDKKNFIITVVNLDCFFRQSGFINIPLEKLGIEYGMTYTVKDLLTDAEYKWNSNRNYIELDPQNIGAHILKIEA